MIHLLIYTYNLADYGSYSPTNRTHFQTKGVHNHSVTIAHHKLEHQHQRNPKSRHCSIAELHTIHPLRLGQLGPVQKLRIFRKHCINKHFRKNLANH